MKPLWDLATKVIIFLAFMGAPFSSIAQNSSLQKIHLIGILPTSIGKDVEIEVTSLGNSERCMTSDTPQGTLCSASVKRGARSVRISIRTRGYKKYELNIPQLNFEKDIAKVSVGSIELTPSELPEIKRVVESLGPDGSRRFELTLYNSVSNDVLIKKVRIRAHRAGPVVACCCPPIAIFKINETLVVSAGGQSELSTQGTYVETVRGSEYSVVTSGAINNVLCGDGWNMDLSLPTSFLIPKSSHSAVQFVLPNRFSIRSSEYCCTDPLPKGKPSIGPSVGQLSRFTHFEFALTPSDEKELDILAQHPVQ